MRTVSHHILRRRARLRAFTLRIRAEQQGRHVAYRVERAKRGPFRWRVVELPKVVE